MYRHRISWPGVAILAALALGSLAMAEDQPTGTDRIEAERAEALRRIETESLAPAPIVPVIEMATLDQWNALIEELADLNDRIDDVIKCALLQKRTKAACGRVYRSPGLWLLHRNFVRYGFMPADDAQ